MNIQNDQRIVLSLDAGGTNLVFSAMKAGQMLGEEIILPAKVDSLEAFLEKLTHGFEQVKQQAGGADAISFAFPGPADYPNGIIGDLENLPVFRGGIALGPFLEKKFNIPVFINNDGDLFTLGEALGGLLPMINQELEKAGNPKQYKQLIGATFGTGFGGGLVINQQLIIGDNSAGGEINRMGNILYPQFTSEESVSIRGIKRVYARECNITIDQCPEPFQIFKIAKGQEEGHQKAAILSFKELAIVAADALANTITMFDAPVVIGGGLSGAHELILPTLVEELNKKFETPSGGQVQRMEVFAYNWHHTDCKANFLKNSGQKVLIPGSSEEINYDPIKKICVGANVLGTGGAVALGAYAFAILKLNEIKY
ncbi:ROK family protein [Lentimicrobium sp. S6]|uniref:ROK family protein n=1 Tax=Lentimicrobium sp. S6 TaxID=2735872 RepID=UPI00155378B6|nr:ROK family protein [Lentimicrobium sp. S6]NPD48083.1 ROK family protein [Lentimicrobium sp. S6]